MHNKRLDLLSEIEQIPEEYITDLLAIVRLFRQSKISQEKSVNAWDKAMEKINQTDNNQQQENLRKLFDSWANLDEEKEQKETLKIIESLEDFSI